MNGVNDVVGGLRMLGSAITKSLVQWSEINRDSSVLYKMEKNRGGGYRRNGAASQWVETSCCTQTSCMVIV